METIKLSKNNFWIKLSQWFTNDYPTNTCRLRKTLIYGILMLLIFPLGILGLNIPILQIDKEENEITFSYFFMYLLVTYVFNLLPIMIAFGYTNFTINIWSILITWYVLGPLSTMIIILIIMLIAMSFIWLFSYLKFSKPGIISELYISTKEKYCKKIIIN